MTLILIGQLSEEVEAGNKHFWLYQKNSSRNFAKTHVIWSWLIDYF